jgi:hypothetical protein
VYFRKALTDALGLGLQVLQVLLKVGHLVVSGPEPALETERVLARAAASTLGVTSAVAPVPRVAPAAAATLSVTATAAPTLGVTPAMAL